MVLHMEVAMVFWVFFMLGLAVLFGLLKYYLKSEDLDPGRPMPPPLSNKFKDDDVPGSHAQEKHDGTTF